MSTAISIPPAFGFVAASVVASWAIHHVYMAFHVTGARKKYGVKYPIMYATEAECKDPAARNAFNCTQRAHQNSLENLPTFYALLFTAGVRHPITAAAAAAVYLAGRAFYFKGYSTGNPDKRHQGAFMYFGLLTLLGVSIKTAVELISKAL